MADLSQEDVAALDAIDGLQSPEKHVIDALAQQESGGDPNAIGPQTRFGRAKGKFQVLDSTAADPGFGITPLADPFDAIQSERFATDYLTNLKSKYSGDTRQALAAYNWGTGNFDNWLKTGGGDESKWPLQTQKYVRQIMARAENTMSSEDMHALDLIDQEQQLPPPLSPGAPISAKATPRQAALHNTILGRTLDQAGASIAEQTRDGHPAGLSEEDRKALDEIDSSGDWNRKLSTAGALNEPVVSFWNGMNETLIQGLSLNYSDELAGVIAGTADLTRGKSYSAGYERGLKQERQLLAAFAAAHPYIAGGTTFFGGLLTGGLLIGAPEKAAAEFVIQAAKNTLMRRTAIGAGLGAGYGTVAGFGAGEGDLKGRAKGAGFGAAAGAVIGGGASAALPPVIEVLAPPVRFLSGWFRKMFSSPGELTRITGSHDPVHPPTLARSPEELAAQRTAFPTAEPGLSPGMVPSQDATFADLAAAAKKPNEPAPNIAIASERKSSLIPGPQNFQIVTGDKLASKVVAVAEPTPNLPVAPVVNPPLAENQPLSAPVKTAIEAATTPAKPLPVDPATGELNFNYIRTTEDAKQFLFAVGKAHADFSGQRRGVMTWDDTIELSKSIPVDELAGRMVPGNIANAEETLAIKLAMVKSSEAVDKRVSEIMAAGGPENLSAVARWEFERMVTRHLMLQRAFTGARGELGRALNAQKIMAAEAASAEQIAAHIEEVGAENIDKLIVAIAKRGKTPATLSGLLRKYDKPELWDKFYEAYIAGRMSSVTMNVVNLFSNTVTALAAAPEKATAIAISKLLHKPEDRLNWIEMMDGYHALLTSARTGIAAAKDRLATGQPSGKFSVTEGMHPRAIGGTLGKVIRSPGLPPAIADEFFRNTTANLRHHILAARQARKEGATGAAVGPRMLDIMENDLVLLDKAIEAQKQGKSGMVPPNITDAEAVGAYNTFTKKLSKFGRQFQALVRSDPSGLSPFMFLFIRTNTNIAKWAGERTPLAVLSPTVRAALSGANGPEAQATAYARMAVGSAVISGGFLTTLEGHMTGNGPANRQEFNELWATGWRPNSFFINGNYYSHTVLGPVSNLLSFGADLHDLGVASDKQPAIWDQSFTDAVGHVIMAGAHLADVNIVDISAARGLADLFDALGSLGQDNGKSLWKLIADKIMGFEPVIVDQFARMHDPYQREIQGFWDQVQSKIPFLRESLPARLDSWGRPLPATEKLGPDLLTPIITSRATTDPVDLAAGRAGIHPGKVGKQIQGADLTPQEAHRYQELAGTAAYAGVLALVTAPGFDQLPYFIRQDLINGQIILGRDQAKDQMVLEFPTLFPRIIDSELKKLDDPQAED